MKISVVFGFAAVIMLAAGLVAPVQAADDKPQAKAKITSPCHRPPQVKSVPEAPVDLSGSGLKFDPRAPGGAHPEEEKRETVPVDPTTTTLFPPSAKNSKSSGGSRETSIPCRRP